MQLTSMKWIAAKFEQSVKDKSGSPGIMRRELHQGKPRGSHCRRGKPTSLLTL